MCVTKQNRVVEIRCSIKNGNFTITEYSGVEFFDSQPEMTKRRSGKRN